jgi:hypothetical protein
MNKRQRRKDKTSVYYHFKISWQIISKILRKSDCLRRFKQEYLIRKSYKGIETLNKDIIHENYKIKKSSELSKWAEFDFGSI